MATAEKHLNEMAKTAGVESVAQLFKKRVGTDSLTVSPSMPSSSIRANQLE